MLIRLKIWRGINKLIVRTIPLSLLGIKQLKIPYETLGGGDGAWSIPEQIIKTNSICYCFGVGKNITFDLALQKKYNCTVYSFDPTPSSIDYIGSLGDIPINFYPWGIWTEDTMLALYPQGTNNAVNLSSKNSCRGGKVCEVQCFRLETIMKKLGDDKIDLLKIDIEGAWLEVIEDMKKSNIIPRVLCVELDSPTSYFKVKKAVDILRSMGLTCICRHRDDYIFSIDTSEK